jgi:hypothetical protein
LTGRDTDTAFILRKEDNENIVPIWNAVILQDLHENFIGISSILKEKKRSNRKKERKKMLCSKQGRIKVRFCQGPFRRAWNTKNKTARATSLPRKMLVEASLL